MSSPLALPRGQLRLAPTRSSGRTRRPAVVASSNFSTPPRPNMKPVNKSTTATSALAMRSIDACDIVPLGPYCTLPNYTYERAMQQQEESAGFFQQALAFIGFRAPSHAANLPPEVEALANFSDAPEVCDCDGPLSWWRYRGLGL